MLQHLCLHTKELQREKPPINLPPYHVADRFSINAKQMHFQIIVLLYKRFSII